MSLAVRTYCTHQHNNHAPQSLGSKQHCIAAYYTTRKAGLPDCTVQHTLRTADCSAHRIMNVLDLTESSCVGSSHGSGVLQVCDQESKLPCIAYGVQLLLLGVPCYIHQAMHEALQLLHLPPLSPGLLLTPHKPACQVGLMCCLSEAQSCVPGHP